MVEYWFVKEEKEDMGIKRSNTSKIGKPKQLTQLYKDELRATVLEWKKSLLPEEGWVSEFAIEILLKDLEKELAQILFEIARTENNKRVPSEGG